MKFESGMAGFLIVALAIGGSIFGTILMSADSSTHEVTKYDYKADVTGLFDTDTSPEYYDYDLSRNYTGYYTPFTVVGGVNYWGGAIFSNTSVNNYPVRYAPSNVSSTATVDLIDLNIPNTDPPDNKTFTLLYYVNAIPTTSGNYGARAQCVSVTTAINLMGLNDYEYVTFKSTGTETDWVFFGSIDDLESVGGGSSYYASYTKSELMEQNGSIMQPAAICMKYQKSTNTVDLYRDDSLSAGKLVRTLDASKTVMMFSIGSWTSQGDNYLLEGDTVIVDAWDVPATKYMDISQGVTIGV